MEIGGSGGYLEGSAFLPMFFFSLHCLLRQNWRKDTHTNRLFCSLPVAEFRPWIIWFDLAKAEVNKFIDLEFENGSFQFKMAFANVKMFAENCSSESILLFWILCLKQLSKPSKISNLTYLEILPEIKSFKFILLTLEHKFDFKFWILNLEFNV